MNTTPQIFIRPADAEPLPSRKTIIDFAAYAATEHGLSGPQTRALMRLSARLRADRDHGATLEKLKAQIASIVPAAAFRDRGVWLEEVEVP